MEPRLIPTYDGAYRWKDMTYLFLLSQQINNSCVFTSDTEEQGGAMQTHTGSWNQAHNAAAAAEVHWMRKQREC